VHKTALATPRAVLSAYSCFAMASTLAQKLHTIVTVLAVCSLYNTLPTLCRSQENARYSLHLDWLWQVISSSISKMLMLCCCSVTARPSTKHVDTDMYAALCLQATAGIESFQMAPVDSNLWPCQPRAGVWLASCADCSQEIYQRGEASTNSCSLVCNLLLCSAEHHRPQLKL